MGICVSGMGRVAAKEFKGKDVVRVFIAASLKEAGQVEEILSGEEIDYLVEIEGFLSGPLISPASGVAFYVLRGQASFCRRRLAEAGLRRGVVDDEHGAG